MSFDAPSHNLLVDALEEARSMLRRSPSVVRLEFPAVFIGDTHGDLLSLDRALGTENLGQPVILGDFIDRSPEDISNSVPCAYRVLRLIAEGVTVLRGNHENFGFMSVHPFDLLTDLRFLYNDWRDLLDLFQEVFLLLPLAAVSETVFASHAGIPPCDVHSVNKGDPEHSGFLTWGDPADYAPFRGTERYNFNYRSYHDFLTSGGLKVMIRGHTPDLNGTVVYSSCYTIFTSRTYECRGGGGVNIIHLEGEIDSPGEVRLMTFDGVWREKRTWPL